MTSSAQMPLVTGGRHSENLTFSALLCEQMENKKKRASDDETKKNQEHRNIATLSLQLRS